MTEELQQQEQDQAAGCLSAARDQLEDAIEVFRRVKNEVKAGADKPPPESEKIIREFGSAVRTLFREKQNIEAEVRKYGGVAGSGALDLEAARDEIRRRMACLRRAGGDGSVPSGTE